MLSVMLLKTENASYYLSQSRADYYLKGGEPPGTWYGRGAEALGLKDRVQSGAFRKVMEGFSPNGKKLVQNAGKANRQAAWDLTFSAPKSVSVFYGASDDATKQKLKSLHGQAVRQALSYLERNHIWSRVGEGGVEVEASSMVAALFQHHSSRAGDPNLHTHAVVQNIGVSADGTTRSILSKPIYKRKLLLGALYRSNYAALLREELGLSLERDRFSFSVRGVPTSLVKECSKRRNEIEEELRRVGEKTSKAAELAGLSTRGNHGELPPLKWLEENWKSQAEMHGLNAVAASHLLGRANTFDKASASANAVAEATEDITSTKSVFTSDDLVLALSKSEASVGLSGDELVELAKTTLATSDEYVLIEPDDEELADDSKRTVTRNLAYTTQSIIRMEKKLLQTVESLANAAFKPLHEDTLQAVLKKKRDLERSNKKPDKPEVPVVKAAKAGKELYDRLAAPDRFKSLKPEQALAVRLLTQSPGRLKVLTGFAGTSKTTTLSAVREAYEMAGYTVIGATLSGKAARELSERAGIDTETVRMRELQLFPSLMHKLKHHAKQLYRAARYKTSDKLDKLTLTEKHVLVLDEMSMIGTKDSLMLLGAAEQAGSQVIVSGDDGQLSSIEAGGVLKGIKKRFPSFHMSDIKRQYDQGDREAVRALADGDVGDALRHYANAGQLTVASNPKSLLDALISRWKDQGGVTSPELNVICTTLNREVDELNDRAQIARLEAGVLDPTQAIAIPRTNAFGSILEDEMFYKGDRVAFTKLSRKHKVDNGTTGTLVAVSSPLLPVQKISVLIDGESSPRVFPAKSLLPGDNVEIRRGYAFTTHKLQGATAKNLLVSMTGPLLDRAMAYVQMSRHREGLTLFTTEEAAGQKLAKAIQAIEDGKVGLQENALGQMIDVGGEVLTDEVDESPLRDRIERKPEDSLAHDYSYGDDGESSTEPSVSSLEYAVARLDESVTVRGIPREGDPAANALFEWQNLGGVESPEQSLIYANGQHECDQLNAMAQKIRSDAGELDLAKPLEGATRTIYPGDLVRIEASSNPTQVDAGSPMRLVAFDEDSLTLQTQHHEPLVTLPADASLELAYASRTSAIQDTVSDNAVVLLSEQGITNQVIAVTESLHRSECVVLSGTALPKVKASEPATAEPLTAEHTHSNDRRDKVRIT